MTQLALITPGPMINGRKALRDITRAVALPGVSAQLIFFTAPGTCHDWATEVKNNFLIVPPVFRTIAARAGLCVYLANRPADLGYVSNTPNETDFYKRSDIELGAFYTAPQKAIVIFKETFSKLQNDFTRAYYNCGPQIAAHEFMHALDDILKISASAAAMTAYTKDANGITMTEKKDFGYLLQDAPRGPGEAFAEAASKIWTDKTITPNMQFINWGHVLRWLDTHLDKIAYSQSNQYRPAVFKAR